MDDGGAPAPTRSRQARLWQRFGWLFAAIWLAFLVQPVIGAVRNPDRSAGALSLVALVLFAVVYLRVWARPDRRRDAFQWANPLPARSAWTTLGVLVTLAALTVPGAGLDGLATLVFLCTYAIFALRPRAALVVVAVVIVGCTVLGFAVAAWSDLLSIAISALVASVAVFGVTGTARRGAQLAVAQADLARLAVTEERSRFSRDLHDLLGHSLTVVTLKAELAGRLLEAGTPQANTKAAAEVADIERLARDALQDVRAALEGRRDVSLGAELAGARQALTAAGIVAELPGAVDDVPADRRELFGWVVREGVTNVLRHSGAGRCWVELTPDSVAICDDGRGPLPQAGQRLGSGLRGLAERVRDAGGSIAVGRSDAGGFSIRVQLQGALPADDPDMPQPAQPTPPTRPASPRRSARTPS